MEFREVLVRTRKARGLSQEELAERLGVSRQAVSKWETGDAQPDLTRLVALADALEISLDELAGREVKGGAGAPESRSGTGAVENGASAPRRVSLRRTLGIVLAIAVLSGGVFAWAFARRDNLSSAEEETVTLPEVLTVTGESFSWEESTGCLEYLFVPSIAGEGITYQITFTGSDNVPHTFDAQYSGGVVGGSAELPQWDTYSVTVTASDGSAVRAAAVAVNLSFGDHSSSWTPMRA